MNRMNRKKLLESQWVGSKINQIRRLLYVVLLKIQSLIQILQQN
jgi:hypothetical protein